VGYESLWLYLFHVQRKITIKIRDISRSYSRARRISKNSTLEVEKANDNTLSGCSGEEIGKMEEFTGGGRHWGVSIGLSETDKGGVIRAGELFKLFIWGFYASVLF